MSYRDEATAYRARIEALTSELAERQAEAERHREENRRLRRALGRHRTSRALLLSVVGAVFGLLGSVIPASATGNLRFMVPGVVLGCLMGLLTGLARDIDER